MNQALSNSDRFTPLLDVACDGALTEPQVQELEAILDSDVVARKAFANHFQLLTDIRFLGQVERARTSGLAGVRATLPQTTPTGSNVPILGVLDTPIQGTVEYFSSGWPVAYLVATVILGVGLFIGTFVHVSQPSQVAQPSTLPTPFGRGAEGEGSAGGNSPLASVVGRITGMVDCQWESSIHPSSFILHPSSPVSLDDTFALSSGLLEITYDTGAKVILQGPCTYEVDSKTGGFLSIGMLTARVEKKAEGGRRKAEETTNLPSPFGRGAGGEGRGKDGDRDQSQRALTLALRAPTEGWSGERGPDSSSTLRLPPSALFSVRTPTATVTDLGTEFGVEVGEDGRTMSHVFRGSIEVQATPVGGETAIPARVLHENESAIVKKAGDSSDSGSRVAVFASPEKPLDFVRTLPKTTLKTLDLVDVVAGGDGFSGRRGRGIDPSTGQMVDAPSKAKMLVGDGLYHRVKGLPFVDGVFIPDSRRDPVQTDSAGHTFNAFGNARNETSHYVWAGGPIPTDNSGQVVPTVLDGIDYGSSGHGMLYMHANKGITFDLDAIRRANPGYKLVRFHTVVGNTETAAALPFSGDTNRKTILFSDDFQSATVGAAPGSIASDVDPAIGSKVVGTWDLRNGADASSQVRNNVSPGDPKSDAGVNKYLAFTRSTSNDSSFALATGWTASSTEQQIVQLNLSIYVPSGPATDTFGITAFTNGSDASGRTISVIQHRNGDVKFHDGREWKATTLSGKTDAWQNLVITADMAARKYSISLGGEVYGDAYWQGNATTIGCLYISRPVGTVGGKAFVDNLCLQTSPKPATFAKSDPRSASADAWVLVDGERRSGRRGINRNSGVNSIVIPIAERDRFLTLVATDGGNGFYWDSILFGDPQLELRPTTGIGQ